MNQVHAPGTPDVIVRAAHTLRSVVPHLPTFASLEPLLERSRDVERRGYLEPDEDDAVREVFSRYLTTRAALTTTLRELEPFVRGRRRLAGPERLRAFAVAFATACVLVRSGRFVVDTCKDLPVVWQKLDEAEPRYGIPRKQFTAVYRSLTSLRNVWIFQEGIRIARAHRDELDALGEDPELGPVIDLLHREEAFVEDRVDYYTGTMLRYRIHSFLRRNRSGLHQVTFALFKLSGSLIAEIRLKWKRKRVAPRVRRRIASLLRPGDVLVTRHDDAASNLFLPGFWPHGALYIGGEAERAALGLDVTGEHGRRLRDPACVLEARKDGVRFRVLEDTLAVDAVTVLRPRLSPDEVRTALAHAIEHEGKAYDFEFDFRRSDKLVCTELIYRAYHGIGPIRFALSERAGRLCLSAEDLLEYAVSGDFFDVVLVYGARGNRFVRGDRARDALAASYRRLAAPGVP